MRQVLYSYRTVPTATTYYRESGERERERDMVRVDEGDVMGDEMNSSSDFVVLIALLLVL